MFASTKDLCESRIPQLLQEMEDQDSDSACAPRYALAALNAAYNEATQFAQGWHRPELLFYKNYVVGADGSLDDVLPERKGRIILLCEATTTDPTSDERRAVLQWKHAGSDRTSLNPLGYEIIGDLIYIKGAATGRVVRLWYMANVAKLFYGPQPTGEAITWEDGNQLWLPHVPETGKYDPVEDIYLRQQVYIYAGTGIHQRGIITAADHQPGIGTLATVSWKSKPTPVEALDDTTYFCLQPWLSPGHYEYLALKAARVFRKSDAAMMVEPEYAEAQSRYQAWVQTIDASSPPEIIHDAYGSDLGQDDD